jgi:hypothetical protein
MWIVISEKGACHYIPKDIAPTIERVMEVHYEAFKSIAGFEEGQLIKVIGVVDSKRLVEIEYALNKKM